MWHNQIHLKGPCFECEKRKLGCHSACNEYIEWKKEREEMYKAKSQEVELGRWTASKKKMVNKWLKSRAERVKGAKNVSRV